MVGVSGSGKTTMAKIFATEVGATRISSDEIRLGLINDGTLDKDTAFTPEGHAKVFDIVAETARDLVSKGKDVLIDMQHTTVKRRKQNIDAVKDFSPYIIAHVIMVSREENERRYANRDLTDTFYPFPVPQKKTMDDRYKAFEMPTMEEGFSEIHLVSEAEQSKYYKK